MNLIIPFTKEITFNTNIGEITSISLEHDWTYNEKEILGNFTISGEYKTHEVSINKEPFEYVLPFSVSLPNDVFEDTINFEIRDFTYDIKNSNTLCVTIEYAIDAEEKIDNRDENFEELLDEAIGSLSEPDSDDASRDEVLESEIEATEVEENLNNNDDTYVTYQIHVMQDNDTIDSVCNKYKIDLNIIKEYNDINNISVGDKIIIPDINE